MDKSKNLGHGVKPDWTLLLDDFRASLDEVLQAREYGAKKYDRHNWMLSMHTDDHDLFLAKNRSSLIRHVLALDEEDFDEESGCYHAALLVLRGLIHLEYCIGNKLIEPRF